MRPLLLVLILGVFSAVGSSSSTAVTAPSNIWGWPTYPHAPVVTAFEKPAQRWSPGHRGVDLGMHDDAVLAPQDGTVVFSGKVVDRTVITIEHPDGKRSSFEPVASPLPRGAAVRKGEKIAQVDSQIHHCSVRCVHWGVREGKGKDAEYINPMSLLRNEEPSVLLPIPDDFAA